MRTIIEFLKNIGSAIGTLFSLLGTLLQDIVWLVKTTASFLASVPSMLSWLPAPVIALLVAGLTLVVLYKVLGRD